MAGSLLPSLLSGLGIDPAIAGGVVLTTVTDVAGFFTFLGWRRSLMDDRFNGRRKRSRR